MFISQIIHERIHNFVTILSNEQRILELINNITEIHAVFVIQFEF